MTTLSLPARVRARGPLAALAATLALAVAGCGGDSAGGDGADPASAVPAGAPLYVELTVQPEGETREGAEAAARKVLGTENVGAELQKLVQQELFEDGEVDFAQDIEPWLGERAGAFFTKLGEGEDDVRGAAVIATTDVDAAREAIEQGLREEDGEPVEVTERTHRGVTYVATPEGAEAAAVVGEFAVSGDEASVKAVIDAVEGDESLASSEQFEEATGELADERLGLLYANPREFGKLVSGDIGPEGVAIQQLLAGSGAQAFGAALTARADAIALQTSSVGGEAAKAGGDPAATADFVADLPGGSVVAVGLGEVGPRIEQVLDQLGQLGALGGVDPELFFEQLRRQAGLDVREDLLAWMGQGAVFLRGASLADAGGALVVQSKDAAATRSAIPRVGQLLEGVGATVQPLRGEGAEGVTARFDGLPLPVHLALAGERFVLAVGDPALAAATDPEGRLADSEAYKRAAEALGDDVRPSFFADVQALVGFAEGLGAGADEDFAKAQRYLDAFVALAAGTAKDGDTVSGRLALALTE